MDGTNLYKQIKLELINAMCSFLIPKTVVISADYYHLLTSEQRHAIEALLLNHNSIKWMINTQTKGEYSLLFSEDLK